MDECENCRRLREIVRQKQQELEEINEGLEAMKEGVAIRIRDLENEIERLRQNAYTALRVARERHG